MNKTTCSWLQKDVLNTGIVYAKTQNEIVFSSNGENLGYFQRYIVRLKGCFDLANLKYLT